MKRALGVRRWIDDLPWRESLERLTSQPTVNIEGLVAGHTGPGGKTVLPARALAKLDLRLVPNMTVADALPKLRAHLASRGFGDIEVNMSGGYDPTETAEDSPVMRAQQAVFTRANVIHSLYPRSAGSWPGFVFTGAPLRVRRRPVRPRLRRRRACAGRILPDRKPQPQRRRPQGSDHVLCRFPHRDGDDKVVFLL